MKPDASPADTIDRIADDAPMLESRALKAGRLDDTPGSLIDDYLKSQPTLPRVGAVLSERWRIERMLGEGGFGAVFEGRDQQLGRKVAIKVLRGEAQAPGDALAMREAITRMEERRRRFRDEARAVARAESANVVTVYDVGEHVGPDGASWPFLVLELVDGTPLDRIVRERPTPEMVLHILAQLASGVATLHERRVVHRDLKPANAMLTADGRVKIIDFGLAVASSDWTEVKGPRAPDQWIEGTPLYMSPEVTRGEEPDEHADLWALGVIAYELVTGRLPWGHELSLPELERRIAHDDPAPITARALATSQSDAPYLAHVTPIILKMLAKRRADRYRSAADVLEALAELRAKTSRATAPSAAAASAAAREAEQPFRYLHAFEEKDAAWFFGREDVIPKLALALEQRGRLVLAGPSGAGKTSVIQAGLVPELKLLRPLEVLRLRPGKDPCARLAAVVPGAQPVSADDVRRTPGLVGERLRQLVRQTKTRVLVLVDALEELLTEEAPASDVEAFAQALDGLGDDARGVLLVLTVRDEYLGRLPRASRALASGLRDAEFLGPPPRAAMIAALVRPVERCGHSWEAGFPEEMVDAVAGHASPLPVLQLAASWVWEQRAGPVLARALLAAPGEALRIGDVLGQYADHKVRAASWTEADRGLIKRMLPVMVSAEGTPLLVPIDDIVARVPVPERGRELLRDLIDVRLLTSLRDERGRECLTAVHTTLIRGWALWREALDRDAELVAFLHRFERDARDWDASGRDPGKLWPPAAARELDRHAARLNEQRLSPAQAAFRTTVTRHARRARRVRWGLVVVLALVAVGATLAGFAFSAQADEAHALRLASDAHRREADELVDFMLGDLRHRLEPVGQVQLLRTVAEKARDYLERRRAAGDLAPEDARRQAAVLRNLSAVFAAEGDTAAADKASEDALTIVRQLALAAPGDAKAQRELAKGLIARGHMLVARGDPTAAVEAYGTARTIDEALAAKAPDDMDVQFGLMVENDRMGDALVRLGELDLALAAQRASVAAAERLARAEPDSARAKRNVLITGSKVGAVTSAFGDAIAARLSQEQYDAFAALAAANPNVGQAQADLVIAQLGRGTDLIARGELDAGLASYRGALATAERVAAGAPDDLGALSDVAFCRNKIGATLQQRGDPAAAVPEHAVAVELLQKLATSDPANALYQADLAFAYTRLGDTKLASGDVAGALVAKDAALAIVEKLANGASSTTGPPSLSPDARLRLARALGYHADGLAAAGQHDRARADLARARAVLAPLVHQAAGAARTQVPPAWAELDAWLVELGGKVP